MKSYNSECQELRTKIKPTFLFDHHSRQSLQESANVSPAPSKSMQVTVIYAYKNKHLHRLKMHLTTESTNTHSFPWRDYALLRNKENSSLID